MSSKEKLFFRFKCLPNDFTFDELTRLFGYFGFELSNKGAKSGSRVRFINDDETFALHRPHPGNTIGRKTLIKVYKYLMLKDLLLNGHV